MKVVWTLGAVESLRGIRAYIVADNPKAAREVANKIEYAVSQLELFPNSGRPGLREGTRELVVPSLPYIVIYRVMREVQILRIFHAKQLRH